MKKVTDKELTMLQGLVSTINDTQTTIGSLELQKQKLCREAEALIEQLKSSQADLEKKYGDVTVSLATGEITDAGNSKD